MALKFAALVLGLLHAAHGLPRLTLQDLEVADDTQSVGSYIREVRAAAPQDYHRTYENEGDGEIGYSRKKGGGGKKGYQHFDSFHKKAGDNYEFEKQDSFGHDNGGDDGAHSHHHKQGDDGGAYSHRNEQRAKPDQRQRRYREAEFEPAYERYEEEPEHELVEKRKTKKHRQEPHHEDHHEEPHERQHEELREGASDGNGGVEAHGHDPRDYELPKAYSWGDDA